MTTFDFSPLFRYAVGFDRLTQMLEDSTRWADAGNGYPPYNIEKIGEDHYRITLAVAGFGEDELSIVVRENALVVEGQRKGSESASSFLYRGIAARTFRRQFQLADHVRVEGANLSNGLLTIELMREVPESMKPRRIAISTVASDSIGANDDKLIEGRSVAA
jgi:molecular chaperone IbpA